MSESRNRAALRITREPRSLDEIIEEANRTDPRYEAARITKSRTLGFCSTNQSVDPKIIDNRTMAALSLTCR